MHLVILYFHKSKGELVARLLKRRTRTSIRDHKSDSLFLHNNITPSCIEFEMTAKALLLWIDQRGQSYFALDPTVRSTRGSPASWEDLFITAYTYHLKNIEFLGQV